ncbi:MAG: hypothetical protein SNJ85_03925 [Cyanobacteriota bacterium]
MKWGAGLRDIEASTYPELNGLAEWGLRQRFPDPPLTLIPVPAFFVGQIGPVSVKLFTLPKIRLNFYAKAELDLLPQDVAIQVSQPQAGATLDGRDPVTLNARVEGNPQLRLLAGIDFTLRGGSVEDFCPLPAKVGNEGLPKI